MIKSTWKTRNVKVVFSNPGIEAHRFTAFIKDRSEIMYYYYNVTVYRKKKKKWKKEISVNTYDFPAIMSVIEMIDSVVNDDFKDGTWQKDTARDLIWFSKSYTTNDIVNEDQYGVSRSLVQNDNGKVIQDIYTLMIGSGLDAEGNAGICSKCIYVNKLSKQELLEFRKTVEKFINLSIETYNNSQKEYIKKTANAMKVDNGRLYEYDINNPMVLENVYIPGDSNISISVLSGDSIIQFSKCRFVSAAEGNIAITDGYFEERGSLSHINDKEVKIPTNMIMNIFRDISDEKILGYNEDECFHDFFDNMSQEEKLEFKNTALDILTEKWKNAVISRTWMNRSEHGFKNPEKIAKRIIKKTQAHLM